MISPRVRVRVSASNVLGLAGGGGLFLDKANPVTNASPNTNLNPDPTPNPYHSPTHNICR